MNTVAPEDSFVVSDKLKIECIDATARYALSGRNKEICRGIVKDITELLSPTFSYVPLSKWETGLIVATSFMMEIQLTISAIDVRYTGDIESYAGHLDDLLLLYEGVEAAVETGISGSRKHFKQHGDTLTQERFEMIVDAYHAGLESLFEGVRTLQNEKGNQIGLLIKKRAEQAAQERAKPGGAQTP